MSAHSIYLKLITGEKRFAVINYPANWALSSIIVCVCAAYLVYKRDLPHDCFSGFRRLICSAISTMTIIQFTDTESSVWYWKPLWENLFWYIYIFLSLTLSLIPPVHMCVGLCYCVFVCQTNFLIMYLRTKLCCDCQLVTSSKSLETQ